MSVTNLVRSVREYLAAEYDFEAARAHGGGGGGGADAGARRAEQAVEAARAALAAAADAAAKGETEAGTVTTAAGIQRVLVAVDDTPSSGWATDFAARLAPALGAEVLLLHVVNPAIGLSPEFVTPDWLSDMHRDAADMLQRVKSSLPAGVRAGFCVREGGPEREIVAAAREWGADLIVLGTHGRGHLAQFLLGSTAEGVVRHAPCPVVTVAHAPSAARPNDNGKKAIARADGGLPDVMPVPPSRLAQDVIEGMP